MDIPRLDQSIKLEFGVTSKRLFTQNLQSMKRCMTCIFEAEMKVLQCFIKYLIILEAPQQPKRIFPSSKKKTENIKEKINIEKIVEI